MEKTVEKKVELKDVNGVKLQHINEVVTRIRDLKDDEINMLSNVAYSSIYSSYNRRTRTRRYFLDIHLLPNKIMDTVNLTMQEFNIICASHGISFDPTKDMQPTRINTKIRFTFGTNSLGEEYHSCQLFPLGSKMESLTRNRIYKTFFVDDNRISEFVIYKMTDKINFYKANENDEEPVSLNDINY